MCGQGSSSLQRLQRDGPSLPLPSPGNLHWLVAASFSALPLMMSSLCLSLILLCFSLISVHMLVFSVH